MIALAALPLALFFPARKLAHQRPVLLGQMKDARHIFFAPCGSRFVRVTLKAARGKPFLMNAHQIQQLSQTFNILFALALIVCAVRLLGKSALLWIGCVALSVAMAQQISKIVQQHHFVDRQFPSTHFAVALALGAALCALNRRFVPLSLAYLALYGAFIVGRGYHTPVDLLGALYALPMGLLGARLGTSREKIASG